MNSPGVRQLAATVENLRRDLKRRRVEEKNLTQLVRRQQLKQTTTGLAERREFFVMQLLALATCDPAAAVAWLEADALRRNALPLGPLSPETLVENVLHTADITAVINGPLPTSAKHISWTRAAAKWYYEWQLNNVVLHGAHHKGLPTPTARLLTLRSSASGLDTSAVSVRLTALPSSARLWAHRFRRRYGLRVKRCGWRDRLPEHVLHQKVFCFLIFQHFRIIRTSLPVTFSAFVPTTTRLCTYSKLLFMRNLRRQRHHTTCECVSFIANSLCKVPPHFQEKAVSSHKMRAIFWTRPAGRFGAPHTCEAHKPEAAQRTPKLLHQLQNYDPPAPCTFFHYTALTTACTSQVMATWQWYNYLASNAAGKTLLRINLDETSIPFLLTGTTGTAPQSTSSSHDLRINATRARARANFSFLGIVCDNKLIQQALPYIFLVRKTHVGKGPLAALRSALPPNVIIWRLDKAWTTIEIMLSLIRILKACLQPWLHTHQPILLFDALAAHINLRVLQALIHLFRNSPPLSNLPYKMCARFCMRTYMLQACRRASIWPLVLPAKTTWLLQPLDVHIFHPLKMALREFLHEHQLAHAAGSLPNIDILRLTVQCIQQFLEHRGWVLTFAHTGFGVAQRQVRASVLRQIGLQATPIVPATRPSLLLMQHIFPLRSVVPMGVLLDALQPPPLPVAAPPAPRAPIPVAKPLATPVWFDGPLTRARTRAAAALSSTASWRAP